MEDWGIKLKRKREEKNLTLSDIEKETNINKRILQFIEEGKFEKLPKGIFAKNFIKQYCNYIGIDSGEIFENIELDEVDIFENINVEIEKPVFGNERIKFFKYMFITLLIILFIWFLLARTNKNEVKVTNNDLKINNVMENEQKKENREYNSQLNKKINNVKENLNSNKDEEKNLIVNNKIDENNPIIETKPGKLIIESLTDDCWIHFICNDLEEDFIIKKGETISYSCNGTIIFDIGNIPAVKISYNGIRIDLPQDKKVLKKYKINLGDL